jgi:branched-chain amino acid transport system ATP-binding protein
MAALLEGKALHTYYGASHILRGVDLAVGAGETVGLMGRNGMGKTTLIRTLLGLVPARSGQVLIDGDGADALSPYRRARAGIGYVPEGRAIFSTLTVRENLTMAARAALGRAQAWTLERILDLFPQLGRRLGHLGDELSGGEQQMLAIGRALMTNPRLLILDEATEGLAPIIRQEIWRTIRLVRDSDIATLIVDKNPVAMAAIADRIVVLVKGRVVFNDRPAALLADTDLMHRHLGV